MVGALLVLVLQAEPGLSKEEIQQAVIADAQGERDSAIPFIATGAAGVGGGLALLASDSRIGHTAAWPLIVGGGLEILAGAFFGLRANGHQRSLLALLDSDPVAFSQKETRRVFRIRDRFQPILLGIEGAIAAGGLATAGAGLVRKDDFLIGVGLGLAIEAIALFIIDWDVYERAKTYARSLERFVP